MADKFYASKVSLVDAILADKAILSALEIELVTQENRPSRWRSKVEPTGVEGQQGYIPEQPEGVYPSSFHGRAVGSAPYLHVATTQSEIRKGLNGLFYYEVLKENKDKQGAVLARPDLPAQVEIGGAVISITVGGGVAKTEKDFVSLGSDVERV